MFARQGKGYFQFLQHLSGYRGVEAAGGHALDEHFLAGNTSLSFPDVALCLAKRVLWHRPVSCVLHHQRLAHESGTPDFREGPNCILAAAPLLFHLAAATLPEPKMTAPPASPAPLVHVLLAEDEVLAALAIEDSLTRAGFRVTVTHNGRQALEADAKDQADVLLTDLRMPIMGAWR